MRIRFSFAWLKPGQAPAKGFKSPAAHALVEEYRERSSHFLPCEAGAYSSKLKTHVWVCERSKKSRQLSSEDLARELQKCMNSGVQVLEVVIGGPDGFTEESLQNMKPSLRWSFGPMTLPHELAAAVAAEQIYRALTILHHQPYHSKH
jgi:23S rRNA (pseudouridine1915-N3)-methyltransferase